MTERLFKASEYRDAEAEHKRLNPTKGDYWWEDHFCPVLVVLAVANDFVTICRKTKDVGDNKWTWDLTHPEILSRADFVKRLEHGRCGGNHLWAVREFERGIVIEHCHKASETVARWPEWKQNIIENSLRPEWDKPREVVWPHDKQPVGN